MKCFLFNNQDLYCTLPKETTICYLKWPTLKIRILHIILNKVDINAFEKYPLVYRRSKQLFMPLVNFKMASKSVILSNFVTKRTQIIQFAYQW